MTIDDFLAVFAGAVFLAVLLGGGCSALSDRVPGARVLAGLTEAAELSPEDIASGLALYCVRVPRSERLARSQRIREAAKSAGVGYEPITCPGDRP